jgi:hypothetical protein
MQTKAHDKKWYLYENRDTEKTWSRNNLVVILLIIVLVHIMKWMISVKRFTTTKMEP